MDPRKTDVSSNRGVDLSKSLRWAAMAVEGPERVSTEPGTACGSASHAGQCRARLWFTRGLCPKYIRGCLQGDRREDRNRQLAMALGRIEADQQKLMRNVLAPPAAKKAV